MNQEWNNKHFIIETEDEMTAEDEHELFSLCCEYLTRKDKRRVVKLIEIKGEEVINLE